MKFGVKGRRFDLVNIYCPNSPRSQLRRVRGKEEGKVGGGGWRGKTHFKQNRCEEFFNETKLFIVLQFLHSQTVLERVEYFTLNGIFLMENFSLLVKLIVKIMQNTS